MARRVSRQGGRATDHPTTRPPQEGRGAGRQGGNAHNPTTQTTRPRHPTHEKTNEAFKGGKSTTEGTSKMVRQKSKLQVIDRHARALGYGKEVDKAQDEAFKSFQTGNKQVIDMIKNAIVQEETAKIQNATAKIEVVKGM